MRKFRIAALSAVLALIIVSALGACSNVPGGPSKTTYRTGPAVTTAPGARTSPRTTTGFFPTTILPTGT
ncbi:MAG TPA: hypothetical protein DD727_08910 [Clostridiales bacterium]|nr:hypothetical protein [Clostridiales bacterium]